MDLSKLRRAKNVGDVREFVYGCAVEDIATVIFFLLEAEPHYSPNQIAELSSMHVDTVKRDIRAGRFGGEYFERSRNQLRVSASGVKAWRESFRVKVNGR